MSRVTGRTLPNTGLKSSGGSVYVVRWLRHDGHGPRQRFFRRRSSAELFLARVDSHGFDAAIYSTPATWSEVTS